MGGFSMSILLLAMAGMFWAFVIVIVILAIIKLALYVFESFGLMKLNKNLGYKHSWTAWIPIYNKYLLVDEEVFSTAEKLTAACKQNGYATIIGAPTMGEGLGFTPFRLKLTDNIYDGKDADKFKNQYGLILKQTVLNYPTGAPINDFNEVDYENCYNTVPDIECPSKDALNVALDLINQNKKHK